MYESMTLKETISLIDACPPWCYGDYPDVKGDPIHSSRTNRLTLTDAGVVNASSCVQQLFPGMHYCYLLDGPVGHLKIVMTDDETLGEFEARAAIEINKYERLVDEWVNENRAVTR